MVRRFVAALFASLLSPAICLAQLPASPVPLYPGAGPRSIEAEPLAPIAPAPETARPPDTTPAGLAPAPAASPAGAAMEPPAGTPPMAAVRR